jgi:hypothetical protein
MKLNDSLLLVILFALAVFIGNGAAAGVAALFPPDQQAFGSATSLCDVSESVVAIGNQTATTVLAAGSYQWAAFVQPANATNTVAVVPGGTAAIGHGFQLTPATTTSPVPTLTLGFANDMPYRGAVTARAGTVSTTINVISCR